jgi:[acyl-carrier-protein] S-malonyltransferase
MNKNRLTFLFPGQGSQYKGMGLNLYKKFKIVKEIYNHASDILGYDLKKISFNLSDNKINKTIYTQAAIFTYNIAVDKILKEFNYNPKAVAGHSLGEYSALVSSNCISFENALNIIKHRAKEMDICGIKKPGKMAAIINLSNKDIKNLISLSNGNIVIANYNSNNQTIISGESNYIDNTISYCKKNKIKGVIPLNVSGAFHSPLMEDARISLEKIINSTKFNDVKIPVYQNYMAEKNIKGHKIKNNLIYQLTSPVLWHNIINNMAKDNLTEFIEVGPGNVLKKLNKDINKDLNNLDYKELIKDEK